MPRHPVTTLLLLAGLTVMPATTATTAPVAPVTIGATTRVSVALGGTQGNGDSTSSAIAAGGRYIAFESIASNVVAGDTNGTWDVFVRDRTIGVTTRVSVASNGTQGNGGSGDPEISADGRYIVFFSDASNLVAGDTNGTSDAFVRDLTIGATTRVSVAFGGTQADSESEQPVISADGSHVAFVSRASNLVAGDVNGKRDVFVCDRVTGAMTLVSVATDGTQANNFSEKLAISADGRYVAFYSVATNLVAGDTNGTDDVFVHDGVTARTTRVSVASDGAQANSESGEPAISADGRYVAFDSAASNLVPGDTNVTFDVFVHELATGTTTRVSVASDGSQADFASQRPAISADGRDVAFDSLAKNLVAGDTNAWYDVFVRDRVADVTTRVGATSAGARANNDSSESAISADGRYVTFISRVAILGPGDIDTLDVFVHDRLAPATSFGDFTGDGWPDLIARQTSTGLLCLYRGNGTGFGGRLRIGNGWNAMNAITRFGDFNRDGHEDVIARESATGALWLYRGTGTGFASRLKIGSGWNAMREITPVGDLNGDGYPDLLAVATSTGALYRFPGRGTGLGRGTRLGGGWNAMGELAGVGDLNRDGHVDLVARATATGDLWLYPGTGTGLGARTRIGNGWNSMRDLVGIGDVDRDGFNDLVAVQSSTGGLFRYPGRGTALGAAVLVGRGWNSDFRPVL